MGQLTRLQMLNPDKTPESQRRPLTYSENIKMWILRGESVLIAGPSGIGKTEIILSLEDCKEEVDSVYRLELREGVLPENYVGLTNMQTGEHTLPDFAKNIILDQATEEERQAVEDNVRYMYDLADKIYNRSKKTDKKVIILLDELLNVGPEVQTLVYDLVLSNFIAVGRGVKLPKNVVVVATGNPKKFSAAGNPLVEPLGKRFDHIVNMKPSIKTWLYEYAIPHLVPTKDKDGETIPPTVHPVVLGYIFAKYRQNGFSETENISYFIEDPEVGKEFPDEFGAPGFTNDPRTWVSVSESLYGFEEDLMAGKLEGKSDVQTLKDQLQSRLRLEWAEDLFSFYNYPTLTVEQVVNGNYTEENLPKNTDQQFNFAMALLAAETEEQFIKCRQFIRKHCGGNENSDGENLRLYDIYWVGNNDERKQILAKIRYQEKAKAGIRKNSETSSDKSTAILAVEDFFKRKKVAFRTRDQKSAEVLMQIFDKMGKTYSDSTKYTDEPFYWWEEEGPATAYTNDGRRGNYEELQKEGYTIVDFNWRDYQQGSQNCVTTRSDKNNGGRDSE